MKKQVENELEEKQAELKKLIDLKEEKERGFEELKHVMELFQYRYFSEVGQKQAELNRLNAELEEIMARKSPNIYKKKILKVPELNLR